MNREEILRKQKEYVWPSVANYYAEPLALERGEGTRLYAPDGTEYLDFFGGILTVSVGHCHPKVVDKVHRQNEKLQHTSTLYATEPQVNLAEKLALLLRARGVRMRRNDEIFGARFALMMVTGFLTEVVLVRESKFALTDPRVAESLTDGFLSYLGITADDSAQIQINATQEKSK